MSLALPAVERMLACDATEGTDYAATVLALLAHESNVAAASASLYLHPNTFRYRLRRTKELFDSISRTRTPGCWRGCRSGSGRAVSTFPGLSR